MPTLSIYFLRAALIWLLVGSGLGGLLLASKALSWSGALWLSLPFHAEILLLGWILQLAFGVAYWILPRDSQDRRPKAWLAWMSFLLLNAGLICSPKLALASAVFYLVSALSFALHLWPRVRPFLHPAAKR